MGVRFYTYFFIEMNEDILFDFFTDLDFLMIMPTGVFTDEGVNKIFEKIHGTEH